MKKPMWIMIGITVIFVCILLGVFLGRRTSHNYISVNNVTTPPTNSDSTNNQDKNGKININTATKEQLTLLPGIGEVTAEKIIDYRTQNGNFTTIEDLLNVNGMAAIKSEDSYGYKIIKDVKPYVELSESTLYTILKRLEASDMLIVRTAVHDGRLRKYYHITRNGLNRVEEFKNEWKQLLSIYQFITKED